MREESVKGGKVIVLNGGKFAVFVRDQKGDGDNVIAESVAEIFETTDEASAEAQATQFANRVPTHFDSDKQRQGFKAELQKILAKEEADEKKRREARHRPEETADARK